MGGLFMIFISQAILCILVFLFLNYSMTKNAELKEDIKHFKEAAEKREVR